MATNNMQTTSHERKKNCRKGLPYSNEDSKSKNSKTGKPLTGRDCKNSGLTKRLSKMKSRDSSKQSKKSLKKKGKVKRTLTKPLRIFSKKKILKMTTMVK